MQEKQVAIYQEAHLKIIFLKCKNQHAFSEMYTTNLQ